MRVPLTLSILMTTSKGPNIHFCNSRTVQGLVFRKNKQTKTIAGRILQLIEILLSVHSAPKSNNKPTNKVH